MGNKLYVGNLPFSANEDSLKDLFSACGTIGSTKIITDRDTGRSKGFAFVEMGNDEEAEAVITKFDGHDLDGRQMKVSIAKPQPERERGGSGFRSNNNSRGRY